ncbi:nucleotidyltransferase family protein [Rhodovulum sulfidophilum]|uniref:Nucleotidyltransferase family protein n=1 Tax=Rhodovulum sulfidophilum TaxID=35806 RepID=A0ABS1RQB3_RHOSU|nr:nucleotidyltransferase family protein [Rhodovulum sulfidophilum]MBL3607224.1 nucleotidyltransferase family protein [Rhodovulum sulfidophilum]MCE8457812.1 nucleotidyltransferase family protein [Rhodovulum sulfidophilum]
MRPASLMIFGAGFGTRMRPLTDDRPKPLIEVAGRPLIDHALALAPDAGIRRIAVNAHYRADQLAAHLADRPGLTVLRETEALLDTGGGLRNALPVLGEAPVFTLNSDAVWTGPNPLCTLANAWAPAKMDGLLLLIPPERATGHSGKGDFLIGPDGRLRRGPGAIYSGAGILKTDGLAEIPERIFSLNRLWDGMLSKGRLYGILHCGGWCDVGHPGGIAEAEALLAGQGDV